MPVMVLKGVALGLRCYASIGHRPMNDVDILVPVARAAEARGVLAALGWRPSYYVSPGHMPYLSGLVQGLLAHWLDFRRVDAPAAGTSRIRRFLVYLATILGAPSLASLPRLAAARSVRRLFGSKDPASP